MKAIILFSGGLDSTVLLSQALQEGKECIALSFDYNQRHKIELKAAKKITEYYEVEHHIVPIDSLVFLKSALISKEMKVPKNRTQEERAQQGVPSTYVPGRNTLFLAYANIFAEVHQAEEIHVGFNAQDYCYPDCSFKYLTAYQKMINLASKQAVEGNLIKIKAPFIEWNKSQIYLKGLELKAPLDWSFSCYDPVEEMPCLHCDACNLREKAKV